MWKEKVLTVPDPISRYWPSASWSGISFLRARYAHHQFARHTHDYFVVSVNVSGTHRFEVERKSYEVRPGMIGLVTPGEVHRGEQLDGGPWEYRAIYVADEVIQSVAGTKPYETRFSRPFVTDRRLADRLIQAHELNDEKNGSPESETAIRDALTELMGKYATAITSSNCNRQLAPHIDRIVDYLCANRSKRVTLDQLMEVAGLSRHHLVRSFRDAVGLPPHRYLTQLRLERGRELLGTDSSLSEVALEVGFSDQCHFTNCFRRQFGISPGRYREGHFPNC